VLLDWARPARRRSHPHRPAGDFLNAIGPPPERLSTAQSRPRTDSPPNLSPTGRLAHPMRAKPQVNITWHDGMAAWRHGGMTAWRRGAGRAVAAKVAARTAVALSAGPEGGGQSADTQVARDTPDAVTARAQPDTTASPRLGPGAPLAQSHYRDSVNPLHPPPPDL